MIISGLRIGLQQLKVPDPDNGSALSIVKEAKLSQVLVDAELSTGAAAATLTVTVADDNTFAAFTDAAGNVLAAKIVCHISLPATDSEEQNIHFDVPQGKFYKVEISAATATGILAVQGPDDLVIPSTIGGAAAGTSEPSGFVGPVEYNVVQRAQNS